MLDLTQKMLSELGKKTLIFDGGMGTQLQAAGLKPGGIPEELNITDPGLICSVHERYLNAGADFITTNTFGCNPLKMQNASYPWDKMLRAAIENAVAARKNAGRENDSYIVLDIGPIGQMLKPLGTLSFDEAIDIIAAQVECAGDRVDAVLLETQTDLYEVKGGILAVKEHSSLPVFVTMTFEANGRTLLNRTFLTLAIQAGLDLPIMNPLDEGMMSCIDAVNVLYNLDEGSARYIGKHAGDVVAPSGALSSQSPSGSASQASAGSMQASSSQMDVSYMIRRGMKDEVAARTSLELEHTEALTLINEVIIPALDQVGKDYEQGRIFLPQLIQSAETTKEAFGVIQSRFDAGSGSKRGPVIICTVEGDVHDIGKNIVKVVCESYGFEMIDLGKDVKVSAVVEAFRKYAPKAIGLSALMTTTVVSMKRTIEALHEAGCTVPVFVGGAVLTQEIADEIGADYYTSDAMASVHLLEKLIPQ